MRRGKRSTRVGLEAVGSLALAGAAAVSTYPLWRPWCLHWGATDDEVARILPGDELLASPDLVTTRAIGVSVPPATVWPWLVQMGPGRAGAYTYDWIENVAGLDMHSANEILPQFQDLAVGDAWVLGHDGPVLRVAVLEPDSALVLRSDDGNWVWAFVLVAQGTGTRLLSRNRICQPGFSRAARAAFRYLMEPGSLVMERKMLLGIKTRAESEAGEASETSEPTEVATMHHREASSSGSTPPSS